MIFEEGLEFVDKFQVDSIGSGAAENQAEKCDGERGEMGVMPARSLAGGLVASLGKNIESPKNAAP